MKHLLKLKSKCVCVVDENENMKCSTVTDIRQVEIAVKVPGSGGKSFYRLGQSGSSTVKFSTTKNRSKTGWIPGLPNDYSQGDFIDNGFEYTCIFH
jgi:hypothetical protein